MMFLTLNTYLPELIALPEHPYKEVLLLLKFSDGKNYMVALSNCVSQQSYSSTIKTSIL